MAILRKDDVWHIGNLWREGESCALIGIGSSGKSRLIQSFLRADVQGFVFGDEAPDYLIIYVDGNGLLQDNAWGLYEMVVNSLLSAVNHRRLNGWDNPDAELIAGELNRYHTYIINNDRTLAFRWLTRAVDMLFLMGGFRRIVLMLDDIDRLLRAENLDPTLFRHLKSLRDQHKYKLCYLVASRYTLNALAGERLPEIDGFYKLVKSHTLPIGAYHAEDAEAMLQGLVERNNFPLSRETRMALVDYTGKHPGLLRVGFFALVESQSYIEHELPGMLQGVGVDGQSRRHALADERRFYQLLREILQADPAVQEQCYSIWEGLTEREHVALKRIVDGKPMQQYEDAIAQLAAKKLVVPRDQDHAGYLIFSPVFEAMIAYLATGRLHA